MTFTYDPSTVTDIERVRFHIGDTVEATAFFTDEEINMMISEKGSWQAAVIACLQNVIARFSRDPKFRADWLEVDPAASIAGFRALLTEKRRELNVRSLGNSKAVYRSDSLQDEVPSDW